jgi:hypothetical protein
MTRTKAGRDQIRAKKNTEGSCRPDLEETSERKKKVVFQEPKKNPQIDIKQKQSKAHQHRKNLAVLPE